MTLFRRCPVRLRTVLPGHGARHSVGAPYVGCSLLWQSRDSCGRMGSSAARGLQLPWVLVVGATDWLDKRPQQRYRSKWDYYQGRAWRIPKWHIPTAAGAAKSFQSCPTLCDPIDRSPPGSPVPGILQARTLEWVTTSFSSA